MTVSTYDPSLQELGRIYRQDRPNNQHLLNKKFGEREVDLAVDGWSFVTNTGNDRASIDEVVKFANPHGDLETKVCNFSYDRGFPPLNLGLNSIYVRGKGVKPIVPEELIEEARAYLSKDRLAQIEFLMDVYHQIVSGQEGRYRQRFLQRQREIADVLNYFADKMERIGLRHNAFRLRLTIDRHFLNPHFERGPDGINRADGWMDAY